MRKNSKRILSLLLTVAMLASCLATVVFADTTKATGKFSDVSSDAVYAKAVETLSLMGVINGYPDGTFGPDKNVTRAEFTAMLMRILNYGSLGSDSAEKLPFTDVLDSDSSINWAIPNINTAYGMGIINGYEDSTFRPNNNVAYQEAVKMVVCTLGYTDVDVNVTPWYSNFIAQAARLGITEYASQLGQVEKPASRACIAQMLYDSLDAEILQQGKPINNQKKKTILSDYLGYVRNTGVISSNGETGLTRPDANLDSGKIEIRAYEESTGIEETYTYTTTDSTLKNYLGYQIEFYYKNDGSSRNLLFYVLSDNTTLTIDPELIEDSQSTNTQIRYYKDENTSTISTLNLDPENVVIYNGKLYGSTASRSRFTPSMLPDIGTVEFLDSDNDNNYDLIIIQSYDVYYVSSKVSSSYSIIDDVTRSTNKELILNVNDKSVSTRIVNTSGTEMSYSSIPVGSVICVARSNDQNGGEVLQTAVVVNDSVTGTITSTTSRKSLTINGTTYEYSKAASWMPGNSGTQTEPALQDSGTYVKDINGKIVAYKKDAVTENVLYGYIMGMANADATFEEAKTLRILTQSGSEILATLNKDVKINNSSYSSIDAIVTELSSSAALQNNDEDNQNVTVQQVIKYTTKGSSSNPTLEKIYTASSVSSGQEIGTDSLYYYNKTRGDVPMKYTSSAKQLSGSGSNVNVSSAVVFMVPSNRASYDDYKKTTISSAFKNTKNYNVEAFDVSTTNSAKVVVCYGQDATAAVDDYIGISVVAEEITNSISDSGQKLDYLEGYTSSSTAKGTLETWLSKDSEYTPVLGDIFRAGADKDGNATIKDDDVIYSVNGGNTYQIKKSSSNFYNSTFAMILGSVVALDAENVSIAPMYLTKDSAVENPGEDALSFNISAFKNARILKYEYKEDQTTLKEITDVSSDYEGILKGLSSYSKDLITPTKVMLYMYEGSIKMFCVLGENAAQ